MHRGNFSILQIPTGDSSLSSSDFGGMDEKKTALPVKGYELT